MAYFICYRFSCNKIERFKEKGSLFLFQRQIRAGMWLCSENSSETQVLSILLYSYRWDAFHWIQVGSAPVAFQRGRRW